MKKLILLSILLIVGCEETGITSNGLTDGTAVTDTLYVIDTLIVMDTLIIDTNIIELDFFLLKKMSPQGRFAQSTPLCEGIFNCDHSCSGYNITPGTGSDPCVDCSGLCMGTKTQNECDLCSSNKYDCNGTCDGDLEYDCTCDCDGSIIQQVYYYDDDGDGLGGEDSTTLCPNNIPSEHNMVLNNDDEDDYRYACIGGYSFETANQDMIFNDNKLEFQFSGNNYSIDISSCTDTTMLLQFMSIYQYKDLGFININYIDEYETFQTHNIPYIDEYNSELLFTIQ